MKKYSLETYIVLHKLSNEIFQNETNITLFALPIDHNLHHNMIFSFWLITLCRVKMLPRFKSY